MKRRILLCLLALTWTLPGCGGTAAVPVTTVTEVQTAIVPPASATAAPETTPTEPREEMKTTVITEEKQPCWISGEGVRLRGAPDETGPVLATLTKGTCLTRIGQTGEWVHVIRDEQEGYVHQNYVTDEALTRDIGEADHIIVYKSRRVLELWRGDALLGTFSVGLGWTPEGHKQVEGDGKTPEGEYYVCRRRENGTYYKSLGVSYPNKADAAAGLADGRIDQAAYDRIAAAIDRRESPSWTTALGGAILIHGCGGQSDWTAGCVGLDNEDMDIVYDACPMGTRITIYP